jgi:hypothetical protein
MDATVARMDPAAAAAERHAEEAWETAEACCRIAGETKRMVQDFIEELRAR